jgi:hypothetical protein
MHMNNSFEYKGRRVRVLDQDSNEWFCDIDGDLGIGFPICETKSEAIQQAYSLIDAEESK